MAQLFINNLFMFFVSFIFVYIVYVLVLKRREKNPEKMMKSTEIIYLKNKYSINFDKLGKKKTRNIIALSNAFIVSFVIFVLAFIPLGIIKLTIGVVILIPLIIGVYHLIGTKLKKGGY